MPSLVTYGSHRAALFPGVREEECESRSDLASPLATNHSPLLPEMRVAERRRLRSSVAPPTEIPWFQRGDAVAGDLWFPSCGVVFGRP